MCPANDLGCYITHFFDQGLANPVTAIVLLVTIAGLIVVANNAVNSWWAGRNKSDETKNEGHLYTTLGAQTTHLIEMTKTLNKSEEARDGESKRHADAERQIADQLKDTAEALKQVALSLQSVVALSSGLPDAIQAKTQPQFNAVVSSIDSLSGRFDVLMKELEDIKTKISKIIEN